MTDGLDILIPCKAFRRGKSRLAGLLSARQREALCRALLRQTLRRASLLDARIMVVSADGAVLAAARRQGALAFDDHGADLNQALTLANAALIADGGDARHLLVLPIDLPLATGAALSRFAAGDAGGAIAADRRGAGTNLLLLPATLRRGFPFRYGVASFRKHLTALASPDGEPAISSDARLAFDLDRPEDAMLLRGRTHGRILP